MTEVLISGIVWHLKFKDQTNHISHAERKISQLKKVQAEASCHCQQVWVYHGNYPLIFLNWRSLLTFIAAMFMESGQATFSLIWIPKKMSNHYLSLSFKVWQPWEFMWKWQQKLQKIFRGYRLESLFLGA